MPKLFEYFGLIILFYSNEHQPIHVHGKYQGKENKAKIIFENGEFKEIRLQTVKGKLPLDAKNQKRFIKFVTFYRDEIIHKWLTFFVYNKEITCEIITQKID